MQTQEFPMDLRGQILYFINENGVDKPELRVPVGSVKKLPDRVRRLIKLTVLEAGWRVKNFGHEKCDITKGVTHFVFIQRVVKPTTRDN